MVHGGDIYRNCISLDYSVNINPLGIPASVEAALREAVSLCSRYPDIRQEKLKAAIAEMDKVSADEILCGNGASELFPAILHALKPKKILIPVPSFYGYEWAAGTEACEVSYFPLREQDNFVLGEDFIEALDKETELIYLANPNNPTGILVEQELLLRILERAESRSILLVLDECFLDFTGQEERSLIQKTTEYKHLFILKSFTKMYAMPGIRLGYGVCGEGALLRKMEAAGQCWGVSVLASEAGIAALGEGEYKEKAITLVREERAYLKKEMEILGMTVWDGQADYLFFRTDGIRDLYDRLLPEGIMIRRCSNYRGLDETCYRVAVKDHEANGRLIEALKKTAR